MATVELNMSDEEYWNCTHRKLSALLKVHYDIQEAKNGNTKEEECYIDNISL